MKKSIKLAEANRVFIKFVDKYLKNEYEIYELLGQEYREPRER